MGNGYNQHHQQQQQQQLYHHIRNGNNSFFLPMLCKLSIKDVKLQNTKNPSSSNNISSDNNEPCSPKVSCMGQVKRNNRVTGFPTPITGPVNPKVKYPKIKKLFSGKNRSSVTVVKESSKINISELDPPLPVVKKVKTVNEDGGLWKRRSGGATLKSLQIQQVHLSTDKNLLQPTTVYERASDRRSLTNTSARPIILCQIDLGIHLHQKLFDC
ncbi:uncharacterized protein LOC132621913 isoform X2 [Lycium barbarum]|uniref:uncharacterized protein LOC132621913 isoform X2 n=1 Tax=Lycium barbarum TaxID=112863 RepID=UPI00293EEB67|nr:uncharacterized protein LOC132621913 isoform X2 [Lycium barbarum]